jgi:hypothetical protein
LLLLITVSGFFTISKDVRKSAIKKKNKFFLLFRSFSMPNIMLIFFYMKSYAVFFPLSLFFLTSDAHKKKFCSFKSLCCSFFCFPIRKEIQHYFRLGFKKKLFETFFFLHFIFHSCKRIKDKLFLNFSFYNSQCEFNLCDEENVLNLGIECHKIEI